ncbi:hypothetical protein [Nonomuraea sp. NPDC005650]|uniref:hypothetical protein n=1 Tax=Nonomuraea sp. NPDC005650 TaxID=3157045 RepID=UPI0033B1789B
MVNHIAPSAQIAGNGVTWGRPSRRTVHHHVAVPGRSAGLCGARADVGDVAEAARRRVVRDVVGQDEDGSAVVMVALSACS